MSLGRLIVPPIAGASTSLALLYLYHQATLSQHQALQYAIGQTRESIEDAEERIRDTFSGKPRASGSGGKTSAGEEEREQRTPREQLAVRGGRSRFEEKKYKSIAEEIKERWNYHLLHLPSTLSNVQGDNIILTTLATISNYTRAGISAVSQSTTTTTAGGTSKEVKEEARGLVDRLKGATLRSEEEIKRKVEEIKDDVAQRTQEAKLR